MSWLRRKDVLPPGRSSNWKQLKSRLNALISIALATLIAGLVAFVAYDLRRACASGAKDAILEAIAADPGLDRLLGVIGETNCFGGMLTGDESDGGGSVWLSVSGSNDVGMLYAYALKSDRQWRFSSAQLDLENSGSFFIDNARGNSPQAADQVALSVDQMGDPDSPLDVDRTSATAWRIVHWETQNLRFEVPANWQERRRTDDELYLYTASSDTHLIVRVTPIANHGRFIAFMRALESRERAWWRKGLSRPSMFADIGNLTGYISWPGPAAKSIAWHGVRNHPILGTDQVVFAFGATSNDLFESSRRVFGTILASIHAYD